MTPAMRKGLDWIAERQPVAAFEGGPSLTTVKALHTAGLIEACGRDKVGPTIGWVQYRVTSSGRRAREREDRR